MSECIGDRCTHPDCTHRRQPSMAEVSARADRLAYEMPPEKWAAMNRAERRAWERGKR